MNIVSYDQLMAEQKTKEQPWLIEGILKASTIGFIAAEPKTGKSFLALHLAQALATGSKFMGQYNVPVPRKVLFVEEEDSYSLLIDRFKLLQAGHNMPHPAPENLKFLIQSGLKLDEERKTEEFGQALTVDTPDLIIFDVLNKLHSGDESQQHMTKVMKEIEDIRRGFDCAVLIIHHFAKGSPSRRGNQRMRGSTVLSGWSENSLYLTKVGTTGLVQAEVESKFVSHPGFRYQFAAGDHSVKLNFLGETGGDTSQAFISNLKPSTRRILALASEGRKERAR